MLPGFYLGATLNLNYTPALSMGAPEYLEGQRDSYYFTGLGLPLQYIRDLLQLELEFSPSEIKDCHCNPGTGFRIGQGMVMMPQIIAAILSHSLQLVVRKPLAQDCP